MMKKVLKIFILISVNSETLSFVPTNFEPEKHVKFLLRIQNRDISDEDIFSLAAKETLEDTAFDPSKPIIFHVHGYTEDSRVTYHLEMDRLILDSTDVNLFFVDWSKGAKTFDYSLARKRVDIVAKMIGELINFMNSKYGISSSKSCCIGFSLGAHICGLIKNYLSSGNLNKIYGIDPAGPQFSLNEPEKRLGPDSASYVECIHTGFPLGIRAPICGVDFFMNKGIAQPGCSNIFGVDNFGCSHTRAVSFFIEALKTPKTFYGKSCESHERAMQGDCSGEPGAFLLDSENWKRNRPGIFHVFTNPNQPYGRGRE